MKKARMNISHFCFIFNLKIFGEIVTTKFLSLSFILSDGEPVDSYVYHQSAPAMGNEYKSAEPSNMSSVSCV